MTASNRAKALQLVLAHEGGWADHPKDPGGATNRGVTQRVYDAWRAGRDLPQRTVRRITGGEVEAIYREQYWDAVHGDDLPAGVDYAVFDYAVNSGPGKAVRELQREVATAPDGKVGLMTLQAVRAAAGRDETALIEAYCARRLAFLKTLKHWPTFRAGWSRRVAEVARRAVEMARGDAGAPLPAKDLPGPNGGQAGSAQAAKAPASAVATARTPEGKGGLIAAVGAAGVTAQAVGGAVSKTADVVMPKAAAPGFVGTAAVLILVAVMVAGLMVVLYQVWRRQQEQKGRKLPATLLGFVTTALSGPGPEKPA